MIDQNDITVIVPFQSDDPSRKRALTAVLARLERDEFDTVRVVSGTEPGPFHKPGVLNQAVIDAETQWVWLHDADIILPFRYVAEVVNPRWDAVKPFSRIHRLNSQQATAYLRDEAIQVNPGTPFNDTFGGGSVLIRRDAYLIARGFNERFRGWGCEDVEFGERVRSLYRVESVAVEAYHLKHSRAGENDQAGHLPHNRAMLARCRKLVKRDAVKALRYVNSRVLLDAPYPMPGAGDGLQAMQDAAVIAVAYGLDEVRTRAIAKAVQAWLNQAVLPGRIVLLELLFDGEDSRLSHLHGAGPVEVHTVRGTDCNRDIFQKEALFNLAAGLASDAKTLIFTDGDIYSRDQLWFWRMVSRAHRFPNALVQGFRGLRDTKEAGFSRTSYAWERLRNRKDGIGRAPGGVWAMSREYFDAIGGWNPYYIPGSGDSAFVLEHLKDEGYSRGPLKWRYWRNGLRTGQPQGILDVVPCDIMHVNHGSVADRAYLWSRQVITYFTEDLHELVELGATGLVQWKDPKHPLRYVLRNKPRLQTEESTRNVVVEALAKSGYSADMFPLLGAFVKQGD